MKQKKRIPFFRLSHLTLDFDTMLNSARTQILKQCTCSLRTSAPRTLQTIPRSTVRNLSTSYTRLSSDLPWFVDPPPSTSTSTTQSSSATLATAPVSTLPPSHLSPPLFPLHDHLSVSPFFDKDTLTYIHAREADPMGSWCDWVVICTLREGRERGLRGAVEGVRSYVRILCSYAYDQEGDGVDEMKSIVCVARIESSRIRFTQRRNLFFTISLLSTHDTSFNPRSTTYNSVETCPFTSEQRTTSNSARSSFGMGTPRCWYPRRARHDEGSESRVWG